MYHYIWGDFSILYGIILYGVIQEAEFATNIQTGKDL